MSALCTQGQRVTAGQAVTRAGNALVPPAWIRIDLLKSSELILSGLVSIPRRAVPLGARSLGGQDNSGKNYLPPCFQAGGRERKFRMVANAEGPNPLNE